MNRNGITFFPLYWVWHDTWLYDQYSIGPYGQISHPYYYHQGHCHFWMMGFSALDANQKAWSGMQNFEFNLRDTWSPRAGDKNFQNNVRIVGRPEWYFRIVEYWRRIYIQEWDYKTNDTLMPNIVGKRGIKWDASNMVHKNGPFREGRDNFVMFHQMPRTLPVEYWRDERKFVRDHYLRKDFPINDNNPLVNVNEKRKGFFDFGIERETETNDYQETNKDYWMIPRGEVGGFAYPMGSGLGSQTEDMARRTAYPDYYYIYPTLEYQKVVQLDWERLPGYLDRDSESWQTGENFGDFFSTSISLPYKKDGVTQSPFSNSTGRVFPPGTYCNNVVDPADMLKYKTESDVGLNQKEFLHEGLEGENVVFHTANHKIDGKWVEQFLGGTVLAKALVTLEDQWGGRSRVWVHSTQYFISDPFEGTDQMDVLQQ